MGSYMKTQSDRSGGAPSDDEQSGREQTRKSTNARRLKGVGMVATEGENKYGQRRLQVYDEGSAPAVPT